MPKRPDRTLSRRGFLKTIPPGTAAAAIAMSGLAPALARPRVDANAKIGYGLIGCGDLGTNWHLASIVQRPEFRVLALCDVDSDHLARAAKLVTDAVTERGEPAPELVLVKDYRALLDLPQVEAVQVVTPDHWHALPAIAACEAGKDVYCEKPLSLTIAEGRQMVDAARRFGRVFQTGSQQRSDHRFHWACDLVRNGRLGTLHRINVCINRGEKTTWQPSIAPPPNLDWDAWLGPAPFAPYTPRRCHYTFRWISDYSGGKLTDWGAHHIDIAQWALGMDESGPVKASGTATFPESGLFDGVYTFEVDLEYASGVVVHVTSEGENGVTFEGSGGTLFVNRERIAADPPEILYTEPGTGAVRLYESRDHRGNWIDCIRSRSRPICDVEIGHRSATCCHLSNIAVRLGRPLAWDPAAERFTDDDEANRMLSRPRRAPWGA